MRLAPLALLALSLACADAPSGPADAGTADAIDATLTDATLTDATLTDAGTADATASDATLTDAGDPGLPRTCEGACRELTLEAAFGRARARFDRAFYGLTAPGESASGALELHVEVYAGGADGCPRMDSPTPARTLIARLPLLEDAPLEGPSSRAAVTLLDFEGGLLEGPEPFARATRFAVTPRAADVCGACLGAPSPSHPGGLVAFALDAEFAGGTVRGHLFATHCDSLDTP
jgi:hypothetical protein